MEAKWEAVKVPCHKSRALLLVEVRVEFVDLDSVLSLLQAAQNLAVVPWMMMKVGPLVMLAVPVQVVVGLSIQEAGRPSIQAEGPFLVDVEEDPLAS